MIEDEKKPFDAETAQNEEETQPDPEEQLIMDQGNGRVWLVKIPRYLMERWSRIDQEGVHLATIRVYHHAKSVTGKKPRIIMRLPPNPETPDIDGDEYELDMVNDAVENQIVIAEREKEPGMNNRARTTILTGRVKHECNLRPSLTEGYRRRMKERTKAANTHTRTIKRIEDEHPGGRGGINMLTSGISNTKGFVDLVKTKPKPVKGQFERMARMPRDQLFDALFNAFREKEHWSIKALREKLQQPEAYLKEALSDIAILHRSGEYNGTWELTENYKRDVVKGEHVVAPPPPPGGYPGEVKMEGEYEEDEEEDEDEDMEEVS